jgi:Domain of unknown function (DUF4062)
MQYHVFLASPGDVDDERKKVRTFFEAYNLNYAAPRGLRFEIVDWENYSSAGVGRPQQLITEQTLERYRESLALVVGIMAQRFGSNSGTHESGTEEEFEWAIKIKSHAKSGFPEVKWSSGMWKDSHSTRMIRTLELHSGKRCRPSASGSMPAKPCTLARIRI